MKTIANGIFKPKASASEAKGDMTTRVARSIIDGELAAREAKTARLRAARLATEAEAAPVAEAKPAAARKPRKK